MRCSTILKMLAGITVIPGVLYMSVQYAIKEHNERMQALAEDDELSDDIREEAESCVIGESFEKVSGCDCESECECVEMDPLVEKEE